MFEKRCSNHTEFSKKKRYRKRNQQRTTFKNENKLEKIFYNNTWIKQKRKKSKKKKDKNAKTNKFETVPNKKGSERKSFLLFGEVCEQKWHKEVTHACKKGIFEKLFFFFW